jgi:hypothetical protein
MLRRLIPVLLVFVVLSFAPRTASADITAFLGASSDPSTRLSKGFAIGASLVILGWEIEYAKVGGDEFGEGDCTPGASLDCDPSLTTVMGNLLLQTPHGISPVQLYGTVGAGFYRERFDPIDRQETNLGTNVGGGVKIDVLGPLRVRVDFRVFKLTGDAVYPTPKRLYVGANLAF